MEFIKSYVTWQNAFFALLSLVVLYFGVQWINKQSSDFLDLGDPCDPQLENACGDTAKCQADESGKKGVCFPKEEDTENVTSE
jgi:membrane protein implicated in regulation of membrane protease activity